MFGIVTFDKFQTYDCYNLTKSTNIKFRGFRNDHFRGCSNFWILLFQKLTNIIKSDFLEVSLSTNFKLRIFFFFRNYKYQTSDFSVVSLSKHFNFLISNFQKFTNTNNPNFRNYHFRNISSFGFLLVQKFINIKTPISELSHSENFKLLFVTFWNL